MPGCRKTEHSADISRTMVPVKVQGGPDRSGRDADRREVTAMGPLQRGRKARALRCDAAFLGEISTHGVSTEAEASSRLEVNQLVSIVAQQGALSSLPDGLAWLHFTHSDTCWRRC